jgi:oxygen-independent coproporphyrinogen-3 oxidase
MKIVRNCLSSKNDKYVFTRSSLTREDISISEKLGLYIHIPFCKNSCPYCPYYKEKYSLEKTKQYKKALLLEIEKYTNLLEHTKINSLYFGGGTPTLMIDGLEDIIASVKHYLNFDGDIALETLPTELTHPKLNKLKASGVNLLSVGVQSFLDSNLESFGRQYRSFDLMKNLRKLSQYNFDTINFDMIFVFPEQNIPDLQTDLGMALDFEPDQITYYPLFVFPYTKAAYLRNISKLNLPDCLIRRKMYYLIHDYLLNNGYNRTSVWSFNKNHTKPFSSVTRDRYVGFGAGAGSYTQNIFYFNVFSVKEYIGMLKKGKFPISLTMNVSKRMAKLFWLYWRFYETIIPVQEYSKLFNSNIWHDFPGLLKFIKLAGFSEKYTQDIIRLNKQGSHWIHLAQNYFALNYVARIWTRCIKDPFPEKIVL